MIEIKVWVDDERSAPQGWIWSKTNANTIDMLAMERVEHLSLDFSLKDETTDEIMYWLHNHPERWPTGSIVCHSSSSTAQRLIEHMVKDFAPK